MDVNFAISPNIETIPPNSLDTTIFVRENIIPPEAEQHFRDGNQALNQRNYQRSIICYKTALQYVPFVCEIRNNLGIALAAMGRLQQAEKCFQKAMRQNFTQPFLNLAITYIKQGKYRKGIKELLKLIVEDKNEQALEYMRRLFNQFNNFNHYLQRLIRTQHKQVDSQIVQQILKFLEAKIGRNMAIIQLQVNEDIWDRVDWNQVGNIYNQVQCQFDRYITIKSLNPIVIYSILQNKKHPECQPHYQYCHLHHNSKKLISCLSKIGSINTIQLVCLLFAYIFLEEQQIAVSWYFFQTIEEHQQKYLINNLKDIILDSKRLISKAPQMFIPLIFSMILKFTHKHNHQRRVMRVLKMIQGQSDEIEIVNMLNLSLLGCYDYILEYQLELKVQDTMMCLKEITRQYEQVRNPWVAYFILGQLDKIQANKDFSIVQIGKLYSKNISFQNGVSCFKKALTENSNDQLVHLLIAQSEMTLQNPLQNVYLLHRRVLIQIALILNLKIQLPTKRVQLFKKYKQFVEYITISQFDSSYNIFQSLIAENALTKQQFIVILVTLSIGSSNTENSMKPYQYQLFFHLYAYYILIINQQQIYEKFATKNLVYLLCRDSSLFEKQLQKFSHSHKISIYQSLITYCQGQWIQYGIYQIRCLLNRFTDLTNFQTNNLIIRIKQNRFQKIREKINKMQQQSNQWILQNINNQPNILFIKKFIKQALAKLEEKSLKLTNYSVFIQFYDQICLLATKLRLQLLRLNQCEQIEIFRQYGPEIILKINKFQQFEYIFQQSMEIWTSIKHNQGKDQISIVIDFEDQFLSNFICSAIAQYLHSSDEHRFWEKIKSVIYQDYHPPNSQFGSIYRISSSSHSQIEIHQTQIVDTRSLFRRHAQIMNTSITQMCKHVQLSFNGGNHLILKNLSLKRRCNLILFLKLGVMIASLSLQNIFQNEAMFYLSTDSFFLQLQSKNSSEQIAYDSTCRILENCLQAFREATFQLQSTFGVDKSYQFLVSIFLSIQQDKSKADKLKACLSELRSVVKMHHFILLSKAVSTIWEKDYLLQICPNNVQAKEINFYIKLLLSRKIKYQKFIDKIQNF